MVSVATALDPPVWKVHNDPKPPFSKDKIDLCGCRSPNYFSRLVPGRPEVCNFIKKETLTQVFSWEFCEILRNICSIRKAVLENFAKFTGKHLYQSFFFNKVASWKPATLIKMRLWCRGSGVLLKILRISRTLTIHRTTGEGEGCFFHSSLPRPPTSQTLRY